MSDLFKPKDQKNLDELLDGKEIIEELEEKQRIYPVRVVVNTEGYAIPWKQAEEKYNIISDIAFKRNDNWTLGAPWKFEGVAYLMWSNSWKDFILAEEGEWRDISEYKF